VFELIATSPITETVRLLLYKLNGSAIIDLKVEE